jgi:hypothetical protein
MHTRPVQSVRVVRRTHATSATVPPGHPTTAKGSLVLRLGERPPNRVVARAAGALDPALTALYEPPCGATPDCVEPHDRKSDFASPWAIHAMVNSSFANYHSHVQAALGIDVLGPPASSSTETRYRAADGSEHTLTTAMRR